VYWIARGFTVGEREISDHWRIFRHLAPAFRPILLGGFGPDAGMLRARGRGEKPAYGVEEAVCGWPGLQDWLVAAIIGPEGRFERSNCLEVSVVAPLLDEQDNIRPLYEQIVRTLDGKYEFEMVFVDDGSTDKSFEILKELHEADGRVRVIRFRRNFGQTPALSAGFAHARGRIVIALDADLQNDPADIPRMIEKLSEGYDVVSGWRKKRQDRLVTRLLPSKMANWLISRITGVKLHDYGCTLKAYRKEVLDETNLYGEMHRFIPAHASWSGARGRRSTGWRGHGRSCWTLSL